MFIFGDNSNIHFSGVRVVCPLIEPGVNPRSYRTYFTNLFELVRDGRNVEHTYFAGSVPPPNDAVWDYIDKLGVEKTLLDKTADGKEQDSVDMSLQTNMFRVMCDNPPGTMALLTGDGSGKAVGKGFLADLERIHKQGWAIEVYAWENTCNRHLKQFAEANGKFEPLERHYYSISFIDGGRIVAPLSL